MKVKCIKLLNADGEEIEFSPWLTLGKIYHVMEISINSGELWRYRIITSHQEGEWPEMGLFPAECFEVISTIVPSNWQASVQDNLYLSLAPYSWQLDDFIDRFYDRDPEVYSIFERERDIIFKEDP